MVERKSGREGLTGGCCMVQLEMMGFGLAWSNSDGKVCSDSVQRWDWPGFLVDGLQGGLQWKWNQTPPCAWHVRGVRPAYIPFFHLPPFPVRAPARGLTCSRSAVLRSLYTNSPTATSTDRTSPAARTIKMPPIFWIPRALASLFSSSGHPLPRHHFSFMMCSLSSSCSCRMAMVTLSRYGEPEQARGDPGCQQHPACSARPRQHPDQCQPPSLALPGSS